jgi:hypothetical protein
VSTAARTGLDVWQGVLVDAVDGDPLARAKVAAHPGIDWPALWPRILRLRPDAGPTLVALRNGKMPQRKGQPMPDVDAKEPDDGEAPAFTWRTGQDIDDSPPGELLLGMLEPDGPTLIYAAGGVGKGTTAAWVVAETRELGLRPLIYDAEGHPREWRRRLTGLGVPPEWWVYVQPQELPDHLLGRPLYDVVPHLGDVARAAGCGLLILDSIMAASNLTEEGLKSDARAPYRVVSALDETGLPSVSIGHPPKQSPTGEPYGSVAWTNAPRLTWLGTRAEGDGHRVRWQARKKNERGAIPGILLTFRYDELGRLCGAVREDDERATRAWIADILTEGPQTVEELAELMAESGDDGATEAAEARAKETIRRTLGRMRKAGLAHKTGGRGAPWALGGKVSRNEKQDSERVNR